MNIRSRLAKLGKYVAVSTVAEAAHSGVADFAGMTAFVLGGSLPSPTIIVEGVIGGAITGSVMGGLAACGLFKKLEAYPRYVIPVEIGCVVGLPVLSTVLGHAIMLTVDTDLIMSFEQVAKTSAAGNGVLLATVGSFVACIFAVYSCVKAANACVRSSSVNRSIDHTDEVGLSAVPYRQC